MLILFDIIRETEVKPLGNDTPQRVRGEAGEESSGGRAESRTRHLPDGPEDRLPVVRRRNGAMAGPPREVWEIPKLEPVQAPGAEPAARRRHASRMTDVRCQILDNTGI